MTAGDRSPRAVPRLVGKRVTLRAPRPSDVDAFGSLGVDPDIYRFFGEDVEARASLDRREAAATVAEMATTADKIEWVIETEGAVIGTARLHSFDDRQASASLAIGILTAAFLGKGLGTEATRLMVGYGLGTLRLQRLRARVLDFNVRAIRCYSACGFREIAREARAMRLDGVWHDDVIMEARPAPVVHWASKPGGRGGAASRFSS